MMSRGQTPSERRDDVRQSAPLPHGRRLRRRPHAPRRRRLRRRARPAAGLRRLPGGNCGSDELLSITLYRDEAGAAESNELAAEWIRENLGEFELERTEMIGGEVMVSRAASEVLEPAHH
jgi:hypothetical protein